MQIKTRALESITPYDRNPRVNDHAVSAVAASISEFGFRQPILIDPSGVIICGHTRWKAAQQLGLASVPVHVAADLTPAQIRAYRIADNKISELADWDARLLTIELTELRGMDLDLSILGFTETELADILEPALIEGMTDPDAIPLPPDAAVSQRGQVYALGPHRLMCGDSAVTADLDTLLSGAPIHLVNTDPPYNVNVAPRSNNAAAIAASTGKFTGQQGMDAAISPGKRARPTTKKLRPKDRPLINDFLPPAEFDKLLRAWFGNIARVLSPGRAFYIWGGYANAINYPPALKKSKLYFAQTIIWVKEYPVLTRKDFMGNHEQCFYGWREGAAHKYYGPASVRDTWQLTRAAHGTVRIGTGVRIEAPDGSRIDIHPPDPNSKIRSVQLVGETVNLCSLSETTDVWSVKKITPQKMIHLTEKPVELAIRAIRYSSREGENILDLFGGSGSTLIACQQKNRNAFLMELDPLYCDVIRRRYAEFAHGEGCDWQSHTPVMD